MDASFKFSIDEKVETVLGALGVVDTCAVNSDGQNQYYIKTRDGGEWFKESQLTSLA